MLVDPPRTNDMLARLKDSKHFTSLNLRSGYYRIKLIPETRCRNTFTIAFEKYEFLQMPFGPAQGATYFAALMQKVHMDDILIHKSMEENYLKHLKMIFEIIWEAGLKLKFFSMHSFRSFSTTKYIWFKNREYSLLKRK